ncbi:hypothetical protein [Neisseria yangbaofengii]|uniref:hypothetical protein n=1 Tax=Neisseria yangbaofengii TaxID=2709396 RepID=UPI0013EA484F|nr:hypothetical protein [Neisseria yangbaofengii]
MSEIKKYTADAIPLPFARRIGGRPESDRLPLPFRRPLGYIGDGMPPPDTGRQPDSPLPQPKPDDGYARVSQGWGFVQHAAGLAAMCRDSRYTYAGMASDFQAVSDIGQVVSVCFEPFADALSDVRHAAAAHYRPSGKLGGCGHVQTSGIADLRRCEQPHTSGSAARANGNHDDTSAVSGLFVDACTRPRTSASGAVGLCLDSDLHAAQDLAACLHPRYQPALNVPCEYYEIPLEPEPDNAEKTYICGIRPPSNRMALRFQRRKTAHAAHAIPLPFACFDQSATPILKGYIMQNTISAAVDGQPLNLLSASFTSDTGGYCWQGIVTLPPDDFVRLNIDGRAKGSPALISCRINGDNFVFMAEDYSDNRQFGQKSYTVTGRSQTALLGDDYAAKGDGTYRNPIYAAQIANEQLKFGSVKLDGWGIADWLIPADVYSVTDKTPMAVLQELAAAAGGFVESDRAEAVVRFKPKWPKAAWEIDSAVPDVSVPSSVIIKISGRRSVSEKANGVFVWANHDKGVGGDIYRSGSDREPRASALSGALYTDQAVLTAAGIAALSATGIHKKETVTLPVSDKYAIPLAALGQIWQIQEPSGMWQGVVTGVTLDVSITDDAPVVTQALSIDRYLDN